MNRIFCRPMLAGIAALAVIGCSSRQMTPESLGVSDAPAAEISSERAAAVADIRRKAADARLAGNGQAPDVYQSFGPPDRDRRTNAQVRAIEAELQAIADAAKATSGAAELAALRKRAADLEALRRQVEVDAEAGTGSID